MTYTETVENRFTYAGEQFDKATGQYYLRARYYDPAIGRFTQEDTYRGDGLNLYAYVANNPVNAWDPSGHMTVLQTDDFLKGLLDGFGGSILSLPEGIGAAVQAFLNQELMYEVSSGINSMLEDYTYLLEHGDMVDIEYSLFGKYTNEQIYDYGYKLGGAIFDFAVWLATKGAGKAAKAALSKTKCGQELLDLADDLNRGTSKTGVLDSANFAQKTYSSTFSKDGIEIYSKLAGKPINTVDDLANALKNGTIRPQDVPIDYIVRDGNTLILNTRSAQALTQAGIPRSQWNAVNRTGNVDFEKMLTDQLSRNGLTSSGTPTVKMSGGNK